MGQKILVLDDKPFMVRLIQHHLEKAGFELIKARNREEAIEAVSAESPQLLVADESQMVLDQASGQLELIPNEPLGIPVIRMTDTPQALQKENYPANVVVLTRPFSPTQLVSEVKRLMPNVGAA